MENFITTLTFVRDQTAVLPALFAFALGPAASLKTWLAVNSLDGAVCVPLAELKQQRRKRALCGLALMALVFGTEFYVLSRGSEEVVDMFFRSICGAIFQIATCVLIGDLLQAGRWVAYRLPTGFTSWRVAPGSVSKPKVALSVLAATAVNVGAYCTPHRLPAAIISTALLYRFMAQAQMRKVSIRMTCIALLSWLALTAVFSAGLIMLLIKSGVMEDQPDATYKDGEVRIMMIDPEQQPSDDLMSTNVARYVNLLLPFVWSAGPGFLVAISYRFDWAQHLALTGESAPTLETLDAPANRPHLTRGVLVPASAPRGFKKPYYFSAMASWLVAQALVTLFFALVDVPSSIKENGTFDLMGLMLAIPLMVMGLVSTAVMRGEMRALWRYTEVWSQKPEEKVAEEEAEVEDEEEGARDEILASYADEKEEVVPEYTVYPVDVKA